MISLYIHIPFCERKCFYCSFVVSVGQAHRMGAYLDCLAREARQYKGTKVQTIYVGGGTPTLMNHDQLQRLFDIIREHFCFSPGTEWTMETNPEGLDRSKLRLLKGEGVNRMSLGIQSLNDQYLNYLGRNHDSAEAIKAFHRIRRSGFDNVNVDLMFSFPGQTMEALEQDIAAVTQLGSDHLSLYALTIEECSRFGAQHIQLPNGRDRARQYMFVCDVLCASGFEQYEVSNFARQAKVSQHNLNYWRGGYYIGLGVGAHSHIGTKRAWNTSRLIDYMARVQEGASGQGGFEELTAYDRMKEVVLFGLRMNQGVDVRQAEKRFGCLLNKEQQEKIGHFIREGFLILEKGYLKASPQGRLVLDELCAQLI